MQYTQLNTVDYRYNTAYIASSAPIYTLIGCPEGQPISIRSISYYYFAGKSKP